jgi:DNA-binding MarR family transcriptional regulator
VGGEGGETKRLENERDPPPRSQEEKRLRAYRSCMEFLETAKWMRRELQSQLETFDLTLEGFQLMELLRRRGPASLTGAAAERDRHPEAVKVVVDRLVENGWLEREVRRLEPKPVREARIPKSRRGKARQGARITLLRLTPEGKRHFDRVLAKQMKLILARMRALQSRERDTLGRLCRKLRKGDIVGFISEMTHEDVEE